MPGAVVNAARAQLCAVAGGHAALAALVQRALFVASAGAASAASSPAASSSASTGGAAPAGQGPSAAPSLLTASPALTSQEAHAHARALPLLIGCYLGSDSRAAALKGSRSEPLSTKRIERCLQWVVANPVVPGYGGAPFSLLTALAAEPALIEAAQRQPRLRFPCDLASLEARAYARLEARYVLPGSAAALAAAAAAAADSTGSGGATTGASGAAAADCGSGWLVEGHDQLSDLLGLLALEVDQAAARHKEPGDKVCAAAAAAVAQALQYCAAARGAVTELHAWRAALGQLGADGTRVPADDVAPLLEAVACVKDSQALLDDARPWLAPLALRHARTQLDAFLATALPAIVKGAASNARVQHLAAALQAVLSGKPGAVESLPAGLWAPQAPQRTSASSGARGSGETGQGDLGEAERRRSRQQDQQQQDQQQQDQQQQDQQQEPEEQPAELRSNSSSAVPGPVGESTEAAGLDEADASALEQPDGEPAAQEAALAPREQQGRRARRRRSDHSAARRGSRASPEVTIPSPRRAASQPSSARSPTSLPIRTPACPGPGRGHWIVRRLPTRNSGSVPTSPRAAATPRDAAPAQADGAAAASGDDAPPSPNVSELVTRFDPAAADAADELAAAAAADAAAGAGEAPLEDGSGSGTAEDAAAAAPCEIEAELDGDAAILMAALSSGPLSPADEEALMEPMKLPWLDGGAGNESSAHGHARELGEAAGEQHAPKASFLRRLGRRLQKRPPHQTAAAASSVVAPGQVDGEPAETADAAPAAAASEQPPLQQAASDEADACQPCDSNGGTAEAAVSPGVAQPLSPAAAAAAGSKVPPLSPRIALRRIFGRKESGVSQHEAAEQPGLPQDQAPPAAAPPLARLDASDAFAAASATADEEAAARAALVTPTALAAAARDDVAPDWSPLDQAPAGFSAGLASLSPPAAIAAAAAVQRLKRIGEALRLKGAAVDQALLGAPPPLQAQRPLEALPSGAGLAAAVLLLEQLVLELQTDKKWRLVQQVAGRSQADAVAPGLREAREALRTLHLVQRVGGGFGAAVAHATDLSSLWVFPFAAAGEPAGDDQVDGDDADASTTSAAPTCLPEALAAAGLAGLAASRLPAETPLAALHVFADAEAALGAQPGLRRLIGEQAGRLVRDFLTGAAEACYDHHKRLAARQLLTSEQRRVAGLAGDLVRVAPLNFDALLRGLSVAVPGAPPASGKGGKRAARRAWVVDATGVLAAAFAEMLQADAARVVFHFWCA